MTDRDYAVVVAPLDASEGGGFCATVPDLPGCVSDGATEAEAIANVRDAIRCWIEVANARGAAIPPPTSARLTA